MIDDVYVVGVGMAPFGMDGPPVGDLAFQAGVAALDDAGLRAALGPALVDHYAGVKRAEVARFEATVTDWEQREYLHLF